MVYVLSKTGQPLMPTEDYRKVRLLLKSNQAKVIQCTPFTIQLLHTTHTYKQNISLGVDAGSKTIGLSATTKEKELYASEVTLRNDIVDLLSTRREFRRSRRSRTKRHRAARFNNRVHSKHKGWLAPSIEQKINTHTQVIKNVHKILPVTNIIIETASFDIQKIKNPDMRGKEYQEGEQLGFWNVREYVLFRDEHKCQCCKGKSKDVILNVHHIESRKTGGDAPNNLITLCETCHKAYHNGEIELKFKRGKPFRDATFMGIMRWTFYERLRETYPNVSMTYGYITKDTRIKCGLPKEHAVDARCISGNPLAEPSKEVFIQKAVRRHNRRLHKSTINKGGTRKNNQAPRYVFGYQLFDKVLCKKEVGFIFARRTSGIFDIRKLDGTKISAGITYKKLTLLEKRKTILVTISERRLLCDNH